MGTKEEAAGILIVKGYSGKIRPHQAEAGKCVACGDVVFVDLEETPKVEVRAQRVRFFHWGCSQ